MQSLYGIIYNIISSILQFILETSAADLNYTFEIYLGDAILLLSYITL